MSGSPSDVGSRAWLPALFVLALGCAALLLRPGIPPDETRYLEVLRELSWPRFWLLTENSLPYSHKPPLLHWLGLGLHTLGLPLELALRCLPVLASAGTVWIVGRIGARLGAPLAGWMQAVQFAPLLYAQALYFDALLTLAVWATLLCWGAKRDGCAVLCAGAAFLTKGPAAVLHLAPLLWFGTTLRGPDGTTLRGPDGNARRALGIVFGGFGFLTVWALVAGLSGGPEFRRELWFSQTASRMAGPSAHDQPVWFLAAILVAGSLPITFLLARGLLEKSARLPRLWPALALPLVVFSLFPGKQPHYLLPEFPLLALLAARSLELRPESRRWLLLGAGLLGLVLLGGLALAHTRRAEILARYGEYGEELLRDPVYARLVLVALAGGALALLLGGLLAIRRKSAAAICATWLLVATAGFAPLHYALGRLVLPARFAAQLARSPAVPLATYRSRQNGLFNWIAGRERIEHCNRLAELESWAASHPEGWVLMEDEEQAVALDRHWRPVLRDRVRGNPWTMWSTPAR